MAPDYMNKYFFTEFAEMVEDLPDDIKLRKAATVLLEWVMALNKLSIKMRDEDEPTPWGDITWVS